MKFLNQNGILVPEQLAALPDRIGFGCPKCDLCALVDVRTAENNPLITDFISKHDQCGPLEALEEKKGRLMVKGIKQA